MRYLRRQGYVGRLENSVNRSGLQGEGRLLTLFSYPDLFGVADNNPYGLRIFCFLKLCGLPFRHVHILDSKGAPRGQLPYIEEDGQIVGDSDAIIAHLIGRHGLTIDEALSPEQKRLDLLLRRLLDDLYWVMSYSRWRDDDSGRPFAVRC